MASGKAFVTMDRLLEQTRSGPSHLLHPLIADMVVVEAVQYNCNRLAHYHLHAFAVMPDHVHLLVTPLVPLPKLTKSLKGITAKRANLMLGMTGNPFWQEESYDRLVRDHSEFERIRNYIEENPVRAGLVAHSAEYRWSSTWVQGNDRPDLGVGRGPGSALLAVDYSSRPWCNESDDQTQPCEPVAVA